MTNNTHKQPQGAVSESSSLLRINRALAMAGVCSRRAADELVASGAVRVNGEVVDQAGLRIDPINDIVEVNGKPISIPCPEQAEHVYIMLHKPVEVVTTASDPQGRKTVIDLLPPAIQNRRVFPVGRLDYYSEGLLLLTTDGDLANRLTHPRWHLPKVYRVRVRGDVSDAKLKAIRSGMTLKEGEQLAPVPVEVTPDGGEGTVLLMTLIQGVNRQIRRMCRDLKLTVLRLERLKQGPLKLGWLPKGKSRELTPEEIAELRQAVGLSAPEKAADAAPSHGSKDSTPRRASGKHADTKGKEPSGKRWQKPPYGRQSDPKKKN